MFKHIFVPTDFNEPAEHALTMAIEIAKKFDSRITLVHSCAPPTYAYAEALMVDLITPVQQAAEQMLKQALDALKLRHAASDSLSLFGPPAFELLTAPLAQPFEHLAHPTDITALAVAESLLHHPAQRRVEITVVEEIVGHLLQ